MTEITNSTVSEQEIVQLEQELAAKREVLELQKQTGAIDQVPHEKEILKEIVGDKLNKPPNYSLEETGNNKADQLNAIKSGEPAPLPDNLITTVQQLINSAFTKSIFNAIKEARATNNAALIDAFHDALVDELYNQLVERKKLKSL